VSEALREYLLSVVAASLLAAVLLSLTPRGAAQRTLRFLCGLLLLLTALGPLARLDLERLAASLSHARIEAEQTAREVETGSAELIAAIIKEQTEAYIWDKAEAIGALPRRVTAEIQTGEAGPYPCGVTIAARCTNGQKRRLAAWIERELAIAPERQEWVVDEAD